MTDLWNFRCRVARGRRIMRSNMRSVWLAAVACFMVSTFHDRRAFGRTHPASQNTSGDEDEAVVDCVNGQLLSGLCVCDDDFIGDACDEKRCAHDCHGRGECVDGKCTSCKSGYEGEVARCIVLSHRHVLSHSAGRVWNDIRTVFLSTLLSSDSPSVLSL